MRHGVVRSVTGASRSMRETSREHGDAALEQSVDYDAPGSDLDDGLGTLRDRLSRLEAKFDAESRSLLGRASKSMALIALVISLVAGGYGLFDTFYIQRQRERESDANEVRQTVHRISEMNGQIATFMAKNDFASANALSFNYNSEKLAILVRAADLIQKNHSHPDFIDSSTYLVLSSEQLNFADNDLALRYAQYAFALAGPNAILGAEALRYQARVLFAPGPQQDRAMARQVYAQARDRVRNFSSYVSDSVEFNILGEWLVSEANFGECSEAEKISAILSDTMQKSRMPIIQKQTLLGTLNNNAWLSGACNGKILPSL